MLFWGLIGFPQAYQAYAICKDASVLRVLPNVEGLPWSVYTGMAGMAGTTIRSKILCLHWGSDSYCDYRPDSVHRMEIVL